MKTRIYAPRIKGDLELGLEPSRIDGKGDQAWARMHFPGRQLPGQTDQTVYEGSTTQKFEVGTKRVEYGRTFRYAHNVIAIETEGVVQRLLANANYVPDAINHLDEDGFYGKPYVLVEEEDTYVDLDTAVTFAANFFQGGYYIAHIGTLMIMHYIVASDLGDGTYCRIYLDSPSTQQVAITVDVEVYPSPYSNVIDSPSLIAMDSWVSFIGMMQCDALAADSYFWLQTQGPCWITPTTWIAAGCPGRAAFQRDVYAHIDGTVQSADGLDPTDGYQRVGYLLSATEASYGGAHIMMQLE